ncbi:MAG: type II toxin-antitoxin system Phd/YefM family antitoxin [Chloroflexota bacterium]
MGKVGIRALRQNASVVVAEVASGDLVTITDRGRPVALLVPIAPDRVAELVSAGRARAALRRLGDLPSASRRRRGRASLSEELEGMRQAERY